MRVFQMLGKKQSGFTLIEMMIVIAVFAIVASIAIPNFMSLLPGMRLNGAARQVMGDLMAARMNAVKVNKDTKVTFAANNYEVWHDADGDGVEDADEITTKNIQTNYHDVSFDLGNTADPVFSPRGTATNETITLTQTSGGSTNTKSITISIAGRVKIN